MAAVFADEICSWVSNKQYVNIGLDYGLVPIWRHSII